MVASARRGQRHRARCSALVITATTVAALIIPVRAQADSRPVILETKPLQNGRAFECRIPVQIRYEGNIPLRSIRVIAKAYDESEELTSTGVSSGTAIIPRISGNAVRYAPVPMQFDLSEDACDRIDGLLIEFASCAFGDLPSDNCLDQIRFEQASTSRPLYLAVKPRSAAHK